jgi:oxygen-dependent protoporphyrinogen oxidase
MVTTRRVAVVGGGISGLATAYYLRHLEGTPRPEVTLLEADERLGGKVLTRDSAGLPVDAGPDALLVGSPPLRGLVTDLGLATSLVAPRLRGAYVWSRGRLRRLPQGARFGLPEPLMPLLRSGLLSPLGALRAGLDLVLPRRRMTGDPSVGELLRSRFGREVSERLVEPLLGGVHAGRADVLSASSTIPEIDALSRDNRSLYLGLRRSLRRVPQPSEPPLQTIDGGLGRLVDALAAAIGDCDIRLGTAVTGLDRIGDRYRLGLQPASSPGAGSSVDADAVVVAAPAFVAADLVQSFSPAAAAALREIPYVDVASVNLVYPPEAVVRPLDATGFLVPPEEGRLLVGCTWLSAKWPHLADPDVMLIRGLVGRYGDQRWMRLTDDELVGRVHDELVSAMGLVRAPRQADVQRWPRALPQYTVGHGDRLERIDAGLRPVAGLLVTGAAYRGVGLAGCVAQARQTADSLAADLAGSAEWVATHDWGGVRR